jgi:predicted RNase H-like HicB family nuclease
MINDREINSKTPWDAVKQSTIYVTNKCNYLYYPIFICTETIDDKHVSCYGVTVPDLPGCYSAGSTLEEAIENAMQAIQCHIEGLKKDNEHIPEIGSLETHLANPEFERDYFAIVKINL